MLCFPDDDVTVQLRAAQEAAEDADLVQVRKMVRGKS